MSPSLNGSDGLNSLFSMLGGGIPGGGSEKPGGGRLKSIAVKTWKHTIILLSLQSELRVVEI